MATPQPPSMPLLTVRVSEGVPLVAARVRAVQILARCQTCGGPRGTPTATTVRDASGAEVKLDVWTNPCGHRDSSHQVLFEAEVRRLTVDAIATHKGAQLPADAFNDDRAGNMARQLYERHCEAMRAMEQGDWTDARRLAEPIAEVGVDQAWDLYWQADQLEGP